MIIMQFLKYRAVLAFAAANILAAAPSGAQSATEERTRVIAIADSALAAISRTDFVGFTDFMLDSAVTFSAREADGKTSLAFRTRMQQRATQTNSKFTERGFRPEVQISGPLASVWMRYDFYTDGKFSHCGVDAFTMLKSDGRWRVATLVWSVEQPPACEKHPAGPPR
ncbi:MAG: hypothetical protein ABJB66_16105 [Gemmatimonadaceae bacterium]